LEISAPLDHRPFVGHGLRHREELHHLDGQAKPPRVGARTLGGRAIFLAFGRA
jgi:hypothetical protein